MPHHFLYALAFALLSLFPFPSPQLQRLLVGEMKRYQQWWWQWDMAEFHGLWNYSVFILLAVLIGH